MGRRPYQADPSAFGGNDQVREAQAGLLKQNLGYFSNSKSGLSVFVSLCASVPQAKRVVRKGS
jgi:hypothetical protein